MLELFIVLFLEFKLPAMNIKLLTFLFFLLFLHISCNSEKFLQVEQLTGHWDHVNSMRNGKPSNPFKGVYFDFFKDGGVKTNFTGEEETCNFQLDKRALLLRGCSLEVDFLVTAFSDTTLELSSTINTYDIRILLAKNIPVE